MPSVLSEEVLSQMWADGNWVVLAPLIREIAYNMAMREKNNADKEDIASETLLKCLRTTTEVTHPRSFIMRVAGNVMRDRYKAGWRRFRDMTFAQSNMEMVLDDTIGIDEQMEQDETYALLYDAVDRLPPLTAALIRTHHLEEIEFPDIARMNGEDAGCLRMQGTRARRKLRKQLEPVLR